MKKINKKSAAPKMTAPKKKATAPMVELARFEFKMPVNMKKRMMAAAKKQGVTTSMYMITMLKANL